MSGVDGGAVAAHRNPPSRSSVRPLFGRFYRDHRRLWRALCLKLAGTAQVFARSGLADVVYLSRHSPRVIR